MKRISHILIVLSLLGTTGCEKYLDITPKGKVIPTKTADFRLLLDQISSTGQSNGFVQSFSNDLLVSDDMKVTDFSASFYNAAEQNALMFSEHVYQDFESDPDWEALYNQVYVANLIIAEVMDSDDGTLSERRQLEAEARVHRAYSFFTLVNLYAKAYNPATAATDLGVPLRTELHFEESLERASVQAVYEFIIDDLMAAIAYLPPVPALTYNYRPVQAAAYGLLARVHLYMNEIAEALGYANQSLQLYDTLTDYNTLPASPVFAGNLQLQIGLENPEVTLLKSVVSATSLFYAADDLMARYDHELDLRFRTMYASDAIFGMDNGYISTEWTGRQPVKGMTTAEVYLIRAECHARAGHWEEALADVNQLRRFRYQTGSDYVVTAASAAEALAIVKAERQRELAFRGHRLFDIKRYNETDEDNISVVHTWGGTPYTLMPGDPRFVLPIARKYIDLNPEIDQNPR